jgi:hypothetical protein
MGRPKRKCRDNGGGSSSDQTAADNSGDLETKSESTAVVANVDTVTKDTEEESADVVNVDHPSDGVEVVTLESLLDSITDGTPAQRYVKLLRLLHIGDTEELLLPQTPEAVNRLAFQYPDSVQFHSSYSWLISCS